MENSSNKTFFSKIWQRVSRASQSRTFSLLILLLILVSVPLTVFVAGQIQELRQRAQTPGTSITCDSPTGTAFNPGSVAFTATLHGTDRIDVSGALVATINIDGINQEPYRYPVSPHPGSDITGTESINVTSAGSHVYGISAIFVPSSSSDASHRIDFGICSNSFIIRSAPASPTPTIAPCRNPQVTNSCSSNASTESPGTGCVLCTENDVQKDTGTVTNCNSGVKDCTYNGVPNEGQNISVATRYSSCHIKNYDCPDGTGGWINKNIQTSNASYTCPITERGCIGTPYSSCPVYRGDTHNCAIPPVPATSITPTPTGSNSKTFTIAGSVWTDSNGDGAQQSTEKGIADVPVTISVVVGYTQNTNSSGEFSFPNISSYGTYTVSIPSSYELSRGSSYNPTNILINENTYVIQRIRWGVKPRSVTPPKTTTVPSPTPKPRCPVVAHYCSAGNTCQDSRFEPDNRYICGDGQSQTCCILKGSPTPPPACTGCQSVGAWNVCADDDRLCSGGKVCKSGACVPPVGGITTTINPPPVTKTIVPSPSKSPTPIVTKTPTPTPTKTVTPTPIVTKTPTPTPTKTVTPTPTDDDGSGERTRFDITVALQAIGKVTKGNTDPKHKERQLKIEVFNKDSGTPVLTKVGTINYEDSTGFFKALVDMGTTLRTGDYAVKLKVIGPIGYLAKLVPPGIVRIRAGETNRIPQVVPSLTLVVGDINLDNKLDIKDYNEYLSCFGKKADDPKLCKDKVAVDLNDDGKTDVSGKKLEDYVWLFDSFQNQYGD